MLVPLNIIRELYDASWWENSNLSGLIISSDRVAKTIAAAGIDLAGPRPIGADWLVVSTVPEVHYLSYITTLFPGKFRVETQRSERCYVHTTGVVTIEACDEHANLVRATALDYEFDRQGALIRLNSTDRASNTQIDKASCVRTKGDKTPLTDEQALGVMAALLREFNRFRLSLSHRTVKQHERMVTAGKRYGSELDKHLSHGPPDPPAEIVRDLCGSLTKQHEGQIEFIKVWTQSQREARAQFMGPLQVAFQLLYGKAATSGYELVGETERLEADTPFIRFAEAFFIMVGCPCKRNTINRALTDCRASFPFAGVEPRRHKVKKRMR